MSETRSSTRPPPSSQSPFRAAHGQAKTFRGPVSIDGVFGTDDSLLLVMESIRHGTDTFFEGFITPPPPHFFTSKEQQEAAWRTALPCITESFRILNFLDTALAHSPSDLDQLKANDPVLIEFVRSQHRGDPPLSPEAASQTIEQAAKYVALFETFFGNQPQQRAVARHIVQQAREKLLRSLTNPDSPSFCHAEADFLQSTTPRLGEPATKSFLGTVPTSPMTYFMPQLNENGTIQLDHQNRPIFHAVAVPSFLNAFPTITKQAEPYFQTNNPLGAFIALTGGFFEYLATRMWINPPEGSIDAETLTKMSLSRMFLDQKERFSNLAAATSAYSPEVFLRRPLPKPREQSHPDFQLTL